VDVSAACFVTVAEELARGWMSLAGAMGSHSVVTYLIKTFGTPAQRETYLPRLATGEIRAAMALTEPGGGSDLQAMTTTATPDGDDLLLRGAKTWITNVRRAGLVAVLCRTSEGFAVVLVEAGAGYEVSATCRSSATRAWSRARSASTTSACPGRPRSAASWCAASRR
jgi:alkylation response protein AidB-like acyl-CoA dehydrogenase